MKVLHNEPRAFELHCSHSEVSNSASSLVHCEAIVTQGWQDCYRNSESLNF